MWNSLCQWLLVYSWDDHPDPLTPVEAKGEKDQGQDHTWDQLYFHSAQDRTLWLRQQLMPSDTPLFTRLKAIFPAGPKREKHLKVLQELLGPLAQQRVDLRPHPHMKNPDRFAWGILKAEDDDRGVITLHLRPWLEPWGRRMSEITPLTRTVTPLRWDPALMPTRVYTRVRWLLGVDFAHRRVTHVVPTVGARDWTPAYAQARAKMFDHGTLMVAHKYRKQRHTTLFLTKNAFRDRYPEAPGTRLWHRLALARGDWTEQFMPATQFRALPGAVVLERQTASLWAERRQRGELHATPQPTQTQPIISIGSHEELRQGLKHMAQQQGCVYVADLATAQLVQSAHSCVSTVKGHMDISSTKCKMSLLYQPLPEGTLATQPWVFVTLGYVHADVRRWAGASGPGVIFHLRLGKYIQLVKNLHYTSWKEFSTPHRAAPARKKRRIHTQ